MVAKSSLVGLTGLARRLVAEGVIDEAQAKDCQEKASKQKLSLVHLIVEQKLAAPADIALVASHEFGMPLMDTSAMDAEQFATRLVSEELVERHHVFPLFKRGNKLFVAVSDPTNVRALDEIKFHTNLSVEAILVAEDALAKLIEQGGADGGGLGDALGEDDEGLEDVEFGDTDVGNDDDQGVSASAADETPVVKFVNKVLIDAIKRGASDIHFEPYEKKYRVRYRLDGVLKSVASPPIKMGPRLSARLKVMSNLDISERRIPQDGRIKLNLSRGKAIDFRVSTCPTLFGEKIVLRVLDAAAATLGIEKLGYEEDQQQLFMDAIHKPYGMVLVTGPTGSGKTVSLYTALNILNTDERNISTAEDPVEIRLPGINQVQQNIKAGMTFAAALRSFLRQDPDIIMVGEIRDLETAEIAIKAAQTGHMVLSTLHTNDAPQTVARLMNMGIAPFNITSAVTLVIAQRLARRICEECKRPVELPKEALLKEGFEEEEIPNLTIYEAPGCPSCNEGYKGRVGIYQVMPMTEEVQQIILEGGNALQIAAAAERSGIADLRASALNKVRQGITSLAEINRVTKD
jgi:type IV pilus assembly protein PilB